MRRVLFVPEVRLYLKDLAPVLYDLGYFSYLESSQNYVKELVVDVIANLPKRQHKPVSKYFDRYGKNMHYASFRKNKQTVWHAFFTTHEVENEKIYLVRYIANNHTIAQYL